MGVKVGCAHAGEGVAALALDPGCQSSEGTLRAEPQRNCLVWRKTRWNKMSDQNAQYVEQKPEQMGPKLPLAIPPAVEGRTGIWGGCGYEEVSGKKGPDRRGGRVCMCVSSEALVATGCAEDKGDTTRKRRGKYPSRCLPTGSLTRLFVGKARE
jgi:hypothetical protein